MNCLFAITATSAVSLEISSQGCCNGAAAKMRRNPAQWVLYRQNQGFIEDARLKLVNSMENRALERNRQRQEQTPAKTGVCPVARTEPVLDDDFMTASSRILSTATSGHSDVPSLFPPGRPAQGICGSRVRLCICLVTRDREFFRRNVLPASASAATHPAGFLVAGVGLGTPSHS